MHAFWEIVASNALVAALLALCVALLGRVWKNPVGLHVLWLLVLVKLITPPVVTVRLPLPAGMPPVASEEDEAVPDVTQSPPVEGSARRGIAYATTDGGDRRVSDERAVPESHPLPIEVAPPVAERHGTDWLNILAWTWGVGIGVFASGHGWGILRFRRLVGAGEVPSPAVLTMAERIGKRLGLRQIPEIRMLRIRLSPLVWSIGGRPRVVLPAELFEWLDAEAQEAILAHELAHVRRKDHWVRLLELAVTTLFWWHPVVWWACRELREFEEQCCDGLVLGAVAHGARAYATALLDTLDYLSERSVAVPVAATGARFSISLAS